MALPPPPPPLPPTEFRGGLRTGLLNFGLSPWPFGHLRIDYDEILIWGIGIKIEANRSNTRGIHVKRGAVSTRIHIVYRSGVESRTFFNAYDTNSIIANLRYRGWTVYDAHKLPELAPMP